MIYIINDTLYYDVLEGVKAMREIKVKQIEDLKSRLVFILQ